MATERRVWFVLNPASSDEYCFVLIASQGCSEDGMKVKVFLVAFCLLINVFLIIEFAKET